MSGKGLPDPSSELCREIRKLSPLDVPGSSGLGAAQIAAGTGYAAGLGRAAVGPDPWKEHTARKPRGWVPGN